MKKINSKVYVCGDLHGASLFNDDANKINPEVWIESKILSKDDVLIVLGDFGYLWHTLGTNQQQENNLDQLADLNYTIAVVPGNHENYNEIFGLPETDKWGAKVWELKRKTGSIYFLQRGEVYQINGRKILTIGGAKSIDKAYREEDKTWRMLEYLTQKEIDNTIKNVEKHKIFDYILTHTCPKCLIPYFLGYEDGSTKMLDDVAIFLEFIRKKLKPEFKQRHFGHLHVDGCTEDNKFYCHYNNMPILLEGHLPSL